MAVNQEERNDPKTNGHIIGPEKIKGEKGEKGEQGDWRFN